jgi:predicted site-specific integrase-resolvase
MVDNYDKQSFMGGKKASEYLGVHYRTLYNWDKDGRIENCKKENVVAIKEWYDETRRFLPDGTIIL